MIRITQSALIFLILMCFELPARAQTAAPAPTTSGAQSGPPAQEQSLGDYVRKMHKSTDTATNKPKVFDNDNLPVDDKISVVGQAGGLNASAAPAPVADSKDASKAASAADDPTKKQAEWQSWKDRISTQKDAVDLSTRELDVLQREYQLRAAEMYADAGNRLRNSGQWDKQDADYKQKIADKQKAVEDAKQKLEEMQEQGRKAGVPSSMLD